MEFIIYQAGTKIIKSNYLSKCSGTCTCSSGAFYPLKDRLSGMKAGE
ncbi:MAG: hypothetical protein HY738_09420 [Bacteroidia bacterium]|nr:hypothetical protein [Bacteroidia bacterium]